MKKLVPVFVLALAGCGGDLEETPEDNPDEIDVSEQEQFDCAALTEDECGEEVRCSPAAGVPAQQFCTPGSDDYVYYGCVPKQIEPTCGEEVICVVTDVGQFYLSNNCNPGQFPLCDEVC